MNKERILLKSDLAWCVGYIQGFAGERTPEYLEKIIKRWNLSSTRSTDSKNKEDDKDVS